MNPFRQTIVASPWETTPGDVPEIHGSVFNHCLLGIEHVRRNHRSAALLIHGEAGSGKTHLLSRLRARLAPQAPSATNRHECLYVWVRLQTSPRMIWRTLRRTLVDDWFRPAAGAHSQFERILFHRLAEIRPAEGDLERWYEYMLDKHPEGLAELMEEIAVNLDLDRNTALAFSHIAFGRHLRDLRAWLAGMSLPQAALERMDLAADDGSDEELEERSRQVVLMLCHLAGNGLPIVLSFDQVEALQMAPGDRDALFSYGQLISSLHDSTTNVLLVSCVQSAFYTEFKDHARAADYDRMISLGAYSLDPLNRAQAEHLITKRLADAANAVFPTPRPFACWPLEPREFEGLFPNGISPRKLLSLCAERFESRIAGAAADQMNAPVLDVASAPSHSAAVATFLEEKWQATFEQKLAVNSAEQTKEILEHGLPLLVKLITPAAKFARDELLPDVALILESSKGRTGLTVCTQSNMNSLSALLKRLKKQLSLQRLQRLVLVRDARVPLSPSARKTHQLLAELEQQPGVVINHPSAEALAALDALRSLLSDAKSGDLTCQGEGVEAQTVGQWLQLHLTRGLSDMVDLVLGDSTANVNSTDARDVEALNELLEKNPMLPLQQAAQALRRPVEDVTAIVQRHAAHFSLLGQPPYLLFRPVEATESSSAGSH